MSYILNLDTKLVVLTRLLFKFKLEILVIIYYQVRRYSNSNIGYDFSIHMIMYNHSLKLSNAISMY